MTQKVQSYLTIALLACATACSSATLPSVDVPTAPGQTKGEKIHDCAVQVLKPYVGELAKDILQAVLAGGSLRNALGIHGVSPEDGAKIVEQLNQCIMSEEPVPAPAALNPA